jgi:hypothetical protein
MSTFLPPCLFFIQILLSGCMFFGLCKQVAAADSRFDEYPVEYVWDQPKFFYPLLEMDIAAETKEFKKEKSRGRGPASTVPGDDIQPEPVYQKIWLSKVWVEDSAGVMKRMKNEFSNWREIEEYRNNWDIESTGLYDTPDMGRKKNHFNKMLLKYVDKRVSGEVKNASKGSALQKVRSVKQALKPNTSASISKNIKLKFRAKILRMRAYMNVVNPWVKAETEVHLTKGQVFSRLQKRFSDLGIDTRFEYRMHNNDFTASVSKPLGNNITAVVSNTQKISNRNDADSIFQLQYYTSF